MHLTALVLAAGQSRRMGADNKLLLPVHGRPLLAHTVECVQEEADEVIVVTGFDDRRVRAALSDQAVRIVYNPEHEQGMATTIRRGLLAAAQADAYAIVLGDMPALKPSTLAQLRAALEAAAARGEQAIALPTYDGRRGHPVCFHAAFRPALMALKGDVGARAVLEAHPDRVVLVPVDDPGILQDVDTPEAYAALLDPSGD